jgi:hypothetical protein
MARVFLAVVEVEIGDELRQVGQSFLPPSFLAVFTLWRIIFRPMRFLDRLLTCKELEPEPDIGHGL